MCVSDVLWQKKKKKKLASCPHVSLVKSCCGIYRFDFPAFFLYLIPRLNQCKPASVVVFYYHDHSWNHLYSYIVFILKVDIRNNSGEFLIRTIKYHIPSLPIQSDAAYSCSDRCVFIYRDACNILTSMYLKREDNTEKRL